MTPSIHSHYMHSLSSLDSLDDTFQALTRMSIPHPDTIQKQIFHLIVITTSLRSNSTPDSLSNTSLLPVTTTSVATHYTRDSLTYT
jgi:hypothetical protein